MRDGAPRICTGIITRVCGVILFAEIITELVESAWVRKTPAQLLAYGEALLERARAYAAEHGLEDLEHQYLPPEVDEDHPASRAHIAFSAGKWCVYWGSRGHWLDVWF